MCVCVSEEARQTIANAHLSGSGDISDGRITLTRFWYASHTEAVDVVAVDGIGSTSRVGDCVRDQR